MSDVDTKLRSPTPMLSRRGALRAIGASSCSILLGCGNAVSNRFFSGSAPPGNGYGNMTGANATGQSGAALPSTGRGACDITPEETAGPYPDKMNLSAQAAYVRQDITEGKVGLPLALALSVVNRSSSCSPIPNARVDVWQCDKDGVYSEYSQPATNQTGMTFLRGSQVSDGAGQLKFKTIYPGWYRGRVSHIHVAVYVNDKVVKTTQMAFPDAINAQVYGSPLYVARGSNPMTNAQDMVFSDGDDLELPTLMGDTTNGFTAAFQINVTV